MSDSLPIQPLPVVTAFLRHDGHILLVRRSERVGSYRGRWSAISGYLEDETPLAQAIREVGEETGVPLSALELRVAIDPLLVEDGDRRWLVYPFLFDVTAPDLIRLDWENTELRWIRPNQIDTLNTVPALADALNRCLQAEEAQRE